MHERSYFGAFDASPVVAWLNSKARPAGDPVEKLVMLNAKLHMPEAEQELWDYLAGIVRKAKLGVAPVLLDASPRRWRVDWRMVGRMDARQGLALIKLLHLADAGLLHRIRKCAAKTCGQWFYAKFEHQRFHSPKCQQMAFRTDPDWQMYRRDYMKKLRQEHRMRERKWLRTSKRKGKKK